MTIRVVGDAAPGVPSVQSSLPGTVVVGDAALGVPSVQSSITPISRPPHGCAASMLRALLPHGNDKRQSGLRPSLRGCDEQPPFGSFGEQDAMGSVLREEKGGVPYTPVRKNNRLKGFDHSQASASL